MIIVPDSDIYISALHFSITRGAPVEAMARAIKTDVIATCDEIESEVARILAGKFQWSRALVREALEYANRRAIRVKIHGTVSVCRDPDDNKILECAERAKAEFIISGDKDLLALGSHGSARIITPAEYLILD